MHEYPYQYSWEESHKFTPSLVDWTLIFQRSWGLCAKIDKKKIKKNSELHV